MSLPSTYTKLDYIESHGTEYFDTGFKANQDTRVVIDFDATGAAGTAWLFGGRSAISNLSFSVVYLGTWRSDYDSVDGIMSSVNPTGRFTLDKDKNITKFNGVVGVTDTYKAFQCVYNLYLLANNTAGTANAPIKCKLYSCKIYNNGTLIRDFIPAMNASGTIGLWDDVNSTFYTNAGTGTLTTGKKHKTLIGGTGYEVKGGRALIGGTGYSIKKGRTLIGGTGYDISFGTPVGELDVGTSVYMNADGTRREFIVVHQGNPDSSKYDASCNGTWVWQKYVYETHGWEAVYKTGFDYTHSGINDWLNTDYLNKFDSGIAALIKPVKIPYQIASPSGVTYNYPTGSNGLETKAFLPSLKEMGIIAIQYMTTPQIGARLDYFNEYTQYPYGGDPNFAAHKPNGQTAEFFTRQIKEDESIHTSFFSTSGEYLTVAMSAYVVLKTAGILPFMILPSEEAKIDDDFNIIAS